MEVEREDLGRERDGFGLELLPNKFGVRGRGVARWQGRVRRWRLGRRDEEGSRATRVGRGGGAALVWPVRGVRGQGVWRWRCRWRGCEDGGEVGVEEVDGGLDAAV